MGSPAGANTDSSVFGRPIDGSSALRAGETSTGLLAAMERIEAEAIIGVIEFEEANLTAFLGYASPVRYLEVEAGVSNRDAVRLHRLVTHCRRFPKTAGALAAGLITVPYLAELASAAFQLAEQYGRDEVELLGLAEGRDVATFARALHNWRHRHLDGHKEAEERFDARHVSIQRRFDGSGRGSFDLDAIGMDIVESALDTPPDPTNSVAPCRSLKQRRADKLVSLLSGESDCEHDGGLTPSRSQQGTRTSVDVVVDLATLENTQPAAVAAIRAEFASGSPISKPVLAQLLCDASYRRVVMDGPSQVLDVGRPTHDIPVPLRRAVQIRDQHCQFQHCDRPWHWCDVHHLKPVSEGGDTSERNLALVCRFHHTLIHQVGWVIYRDPATGQLHTRSP